MCGQAGVWLRVAECHHELGRMEEAVAAYREVVQRAPSHSEARLVLSTILHQLGRPEEAIAVLSQGQWRAVRLSSDCGRPTTTRLCQRFELTVTVHLGTYLYFLNLD